MASVIDPYKNIETFKTTRLKISTEAPFTPSFVHSHLEISSNINPHAVYASRVKDKHILLENPSHDSRKKKERTAKRERRANDRVQSKLGILGKREAKTRGIWKLDTGQAKYHLFYQLHGLWLGYMSELLGLFPAPSDTTTPKAMPNSAGMHAKLVKADFHGSIMSVKQSKNTCLVGLSGIVIHETENAFKVVTVKDEVKLLPKQNTIFTFRIPLYAYTPSPPANDTSAPAISGSNAAPLSLKTPAVTEMEFEIYGNQFRFRAADRAGRKFKHKESIEL